MHYQKLNPKRLYSILLLLLIQSLILPNTFLSHNIIMNNVILIVKYF